MDMGEIDNIIEEGREHVIERALRENQASLRIYRDLDEMGIAWIQVGDWRFYFMGSATRGRGFTETVETVGKGKREVFTMPYDGWEFSPVQESDTGGQQA